MLDEENVLMLGERTSFSGRELGLSIVRLPSLRVRCKEFMMVTFPFIRIRRDNCKTGKQVSKYKLILSIELKPIKSPLK